MGLTLRDGVYKARAKLGEFVAEQHSTDDLIYDLNYAAQDLCSEAQCLETVFQTTWPAQTQEVAMPLWVDEITELGYFSGQFFQLDAIDDPSTVQLGNTVGGLPVVFYTKIGSTLLSPQGNPANVTGDITPIVILSAPGVNEHRTVVGLWPTPQSDLSTTVWCTRFHRRMNNPQDPCGVPDRFIDAWVAYAVARGKEKESMLDEAQYYDAQYEKGKMAMRDYFIGRKQSRTAPTYGGARVPAWGRGSSSVIFLDQSPGTYNL